MEARSMADVFSPVAANAPDWGARALRALFKVRKSKNFERDVVRQICRWTPAERIDRLRKLTAALIEFDGDFLELWRAMPSRRMIDAAEQVQCALVVVKTCARYRRLPAKARLEDLYVAMLNLPSQLCLERVLPEVLKLLEIVVPHEERERERESLLGYFTKLELPAAQAAILRYGMPLVPRLDGVDVARDDPLTPVATPRSPRHESLIKALGDVVHAGTDGPTLIWLVDSLGVGDLLGEDAATAFDAFVAYLVKSASQCRPEAGDAVRRLLQGPLGHMAWPRVAKAIQIDLLDNPGLPDFFLAFMVRMLEVKGSAAVASFVRDLALDADERPDLWSVCIQLMSERDFIDNAGWEELVGSLAQSEAIRGLAQVLRLLSMELNHVPRVRAVVTSSSVLE